jgi:glycerol uptake facilitator-like aquaporin
MQLPDLRLLLAELIGSCALLFAGCGAVVVDAKTHELGHIGVALSFGLVISCGVERARPAEIGDASASEEAA